MRLGRILLGAAAITAIVFAFRDVRGGRWLLPALPGHDEDEELDELLDEEELADDEEPVLGYDGMDRDTVVEWLHEATLDEATLMRMERYERTHHNREAVLDAITDHLTAFG
jgi:hypothetical protein